jgi:bisphosphoglycerate-dependent phosphoglycerate mutase
MAWNSMELRSLKQLGLNSIMYGSLNQQEKKDILVEYAKEWNLWLDWVISQAE